MLPTHFPHVSFGFIETVSQVVILGIRVNKGPGVVNGTFGLLYFTVGPRRFPWALVFTSRFRSREMGVSESGDVVGKGFAGIGGVTGTGVRTGGTDDGGHEEVREVRGQAVAKGDELVGIVDEASGCT